MKDIVLEGFDTNTGKSMNVRKLCSNNNLKNVCLDIKILRVVEQVLANAGIFLDTNLVFINNSVDITGNLTVFGDIFFACNDTLLNLCDTINGIIAGNLFPGNVFIGGNLVVNNDLVVEGNIFCGNTDLCELADVYTVVNGNAVINTDTVINGNLLIPCDGNLINVCVAIDLASQLFTGNMLWVDAVFGNDATAVRQDESRPYLTLDAAIASALPGDTIVVRPGTYFPTTNLAKESVAWNFYENTRVIASSAFDLFDTTGITTRFLVGGYAYISHFGAGAIFNLAHGSNAQVVIEVNKLENGINNTAIHAVTASSGTTTLIVRDSVRSFGVSGHSISIGGTAFVNATIGDIISQGIGVIEVAGGTLNLEAKNLSSERDGMIGATAIDTIALRGGTTHITADTISSSGDALDTSTSVRSLYVSSTVGVVSAEIIAQSLVATGNAAGVSGNVYGILVEGTGTMANVFFQIDSITTAGSATGSSGVNVGTIFVNGTGPSNTIVSFDTELIAAAGSSSAGDGTGDVFGLKVIDAAASVDSNIIVTFGTATSSNFIETVVVGHTSTGGLVASIRAGLIISAATNNGGFVYTIRTLDLLGGSFGFLTLTANMIAFLGTQASGGSVTVLLSDRDLNVYMSTNALIGGTSLQAVFVSGGYLNLDANYIQSNSTDSAIAIFGIAPTVEVNIRNMELQADGLILSIAKFLSSSLTVYMYSQDANSESITSPIVINDGDFVQLGGLYRANNSSASSVINISANPTVMATGEGTALVQTTPLVGNFSITSTNPIIVRNYGTVVQTQSEGPGVTYLTPAFVATNPLYV